MAKEFEHPFMFLLNIDAFPFEKCQLCSFVLLLIGILALFMLSVFSSLYSLDVNLLSDEYLTKIFSHFPRCLLILVNVSFAVWKLLNLMKSHLSILALISWVIGVLFRKSSLWLDFEVVSLFYLYSFQNFKCYIKILDPFWVYFCIFYILDRKSSLWLDFEEFSLFYLYSFQSFRCYIMILDPFWMYFCTQWQTGI
jgi:hypothetical protein